MTSPLLLLQEGGLRDLLPRHLADDPSLARAAEAVRPHLQDIARAIPNLLIWARLGGQTSAGMLPPMRRLTDFRPGLKPLDVELLEQLAWQMHVDFREAAQDDAQLAGMVRSSIAWHRIKGTPASIYDAMALFGYTGATIEEDGVGEMWATWQLGFGDSVPSAAMIRHIVHIVREMQPARCRLWRVYNSAYDWRPGIWSGGAPEHAWSECWWSWYSGAAVPGIPGVDDDHELIVSFGDARRFLAEQYCPRDHVAGLAVTDLLAFICPYIDRSIWSRSLWSDPFDYRTSFVFGQIHSAVAGERIALHPLPWDGPWDGPWHVPGAVIYDRPLPPWDFRRRREWARSQAVLSWPDGPRVPADPAPAPYGRDGAWGEINSCYGVPSVVWTEGGHPMWSDAVWSDDVARIRLRRILEQERHVLAARADGWIPPDIPPRRAVHALMAQRLWYQDRPHWGRSRWGDPVLRNSPFFRHDLLPAHTADRRVATESWRNRARWTAPWRTTVGWGRDMPEWCMFLRDFLRSQAVWSESRHGDPDDDAWGGVNATWARPTVTEIGDAPRWSTARWSDGACRITVHEIPVRSRARTPMPAQAVSPSASAPVGHAALLARRAAPRTADAAAGARLDTASIIMADAAIGAVPGGLCIGRITSLAAPRIIGAAQVGQHQDRGAPVTEIRVRNWRGAWRDASALGPRAWADWRAPLHITATASED